MEIFTIFLCFIVLSFVLLLTLIVFAIYSGLFVSISPGAGPPPIKNVKLAYKFARGPYKDAHTFFTEVTSLAPKLRCVGIYYDDPQQVPSEKLRWAVGTILAEGADAPSPDQLRLMRSKGYRLAALPAVSHAVGCTFPYHSFLSVIIAIFRVYPLMGEYVRINKLCAHPYLEIYDGHTIHFMAPLAKQDEFYVPEAHLEEGEELEEEEGESGEPQGELPGKPQGETQHVKPSSSGKSDQAQKTESKDVKKNVAAVKKDKKNTEKDKKKNEKEDIEKKEKEREVSSKPKVTDSSGKRSPSEEAASSVTQELVSDTIQDSGVSSTAAGGVQLSAMSDTSLSPSPEPFSPGSPGSPGLGSISASDGSVTLSDSSVLTNTDASSFLSTGASDGSFTEASQGALSGFSSESDTESFEVVRKEDAK